MVFGLFVAYQFESPFILKKPTCPVDYLVVRDDPSDFLFRGVLATAVTVSSRSPAFPRPLHYCPIISGLVSSSWPGSGACCCF